MKIRMLMMLPALFAVASLALTQEVKKKPDAGASSAKPVAQTAAIAPEALDDQRLDYDMPTGQASDSWSIQTFISGNFLGVSVEDITKDNYTKYNLREPQGVGVLDVTKDSAAESAGLKKGDVILKFDGETVTNSRKLNRLIEESSQQHQVKLSISRESKDQAITATLGKRTGPDTAFGGVVRNRELSAEQREKSEKNRKELEQVLARDQQNLGAIVRDGTNRGFSFTLGSSRRIGVNTTSLTKQLAEFFGVKNGAGLLITSVNETSPAAKAGLKAGDVITAVDGEAITDIGSFSRAIGHKTEGEVNLTITRDKSEKTIKVTPEEQKMEFFESLSGRVTTRVTTLPAIDVRLPPLPVMPQIDALRRSSSGLRNPM